MTGFACHPDTSNPPLEGCLLVGNHSIVFKNNIRDRPFKTNLLKRRHILSTFKRPKIRYITMIYNLSNSSKICSELS